MTRKIKIIVIVIISSVVLAGCPMNNMVILPKTPYPLDKHREEKTFTYYQYFLHYER